MARLRFGIGSGRGSSRRGFIMVMVSARTVAVAVSVATIMVVGGGNVLRVEVRTQIVSGEPKVGVCAAEQCC